jgi:Ca-activated chloride channel family protein
MRKLNKVGTGLKAIVFGAATNLYDGIMKGYEELSTDTGTHARRLILLTDGEPTAGPTGERAFVELSKRVRSKGISITGLGVGKYYTEDLLIAIAEASEGRWHHLVNPDGLPELLREEVLDMKLVELVKPVLQITPISGAKPSNIYRVGEMVSEITDYQKVGGKYAIPLEDVRAGFASRIVFRLHVPPKPEGKLKVAELAVSAPETELTKNVFVESTKNRSRWSIETDPYPRSLLMLSEATTVSKQAVDDVTQVERAQQLVKTVMLDPDAATVVRENAHLMSMGNTVMRVTDTVVKSKLKREDKKKLKHDATVIYAMEEG